MKKKSLNKMTWKSWLFSLFLLLQLFLIWVPWSYSIDVDAEVACVDGNSRKLTVVIPREHKLGIGDGTFEFTYTIKGNENTIEVELDSVRDEGNFVCVGTLEGTAASELSNPVKGEARLHQGPLLRLIMKLYYS